MLNCLWRQTVAFEDVKGSLTVCLFRSLYYGFPEPTRETSQLNNLKYQQISKNSLSQ